MDHEAEIGLVVAHRCRHVPAADALDVIGGITCVNDVTARDLQRADGQLRDGLAIEGTAGLRCHARHAIRHPMPLWRGEAVLPAAARQHLRRAAEGGLVGLEVRAVAQA